MSQSTATALSDAPHDGSAMQVSSYEFGIYTLPRERIVSVTAQNIVGQISTWSSAVMLLSPHPSQPSTRLHDSSLDPLLGALGCAERLRADLPVLYQNQLGSLLVKCWIYLVWMHLIETDPAPLTAAVRDNILWSMMRPFESTYTTQAKLWHKDNRNVKFKIKHGMRLTSLLLSHERLLQRFVLTGNISTDALVSLSQEQLNIQTLRKLTDQLEGASHPQRITKGNIRALLSGASSPAPDQRPSAAERAVIVEDLLMLRTQAHASDSRVSHSSLSGAAERVLPDAGQKEMIPTDGRTESEESKADDVEMEEEQEEDEDDVEEEEEEKMTEDDEEDEQEEEPTRSSPPRRKKKRKRRSHPHKRPTTNPAVSCAAEVQPAPTSKLEQAVPLTAVTRLTAVVFRHPDDVRGCVEDDIEHDLFCRHHKHWRAKALEELASLSPAALQSHLTDEDVDCSPDLLVRRWGQRVQFVAPLLVDDDVDNTMSHLALELDCDDVGRLFYTHSFVLQHSAGFSRLPAMSSTGVLVEEKNHALRARQWWVSAPDHVRDTDGGNSSHLLALHRLFRMDGHTTSVPLNVLLRLGCMLVVAVHVENNVVYVPSASAYQSTQLIVAVPDESMTVSGNVLSPRHVARLVHQHEKEGPTDDVRLSWAASDSVGLESYLIPHSNVSLSVPTSASIEAIRAFLSEVSEEDPRFHPEHRSQSLMPDLYLSAQAYRILSKAMQGDHLPSTATVNQMFDMVDSSSSTLTRTIATALTIQAARLDKPPADWHSCSSRFGCPLHVKDKMTPQSKHVVQQIYNIKRTPVVVVMPRKSTLTQAVVMDSSTGNQVSEEALAQLQQLLGARVANGFLLEQCTSPARVRWRNSGTLVSPLLNQPHHVAAWHMLVPMSSSADSETLSFAPSDALMQREDEKENHEECSPDSIAEIYQAYIAKSKLIAGSDHLLDNMLIPKKRGAAAPDLYAGSVSLAFGELTKDSGSKVIEALGLTTKSRLLDVGSAFGRFCVHAALASGAAVTGVEAGIKRADLASQFLEEVTNEHCSTMSTARPKIKLVQGDILCHLNELWAHSHIFLFDARFMESTWQILAHLLSYLSAVAGQVIISCQALDKCNPDLVRGDFVELTLSGGKQSFIAHRYTVDERRKLCHLVEVFESPIHGLGLRATRAIVAGQVIMRCEGEVIFDRVFSQLADIVKSGMFPYLARLPSEDKRSQKAFLHGLDVSRYINSHAGTGRPCNVKLTALDTDELNVVATKDIAKGEELLADYHNWSNDSGGAAPWLGDPDLRSV